MRVALADGWVDLDEGLVHRGSEASNLTETERALLTYLAERSGQVVERGELLRKVWGYSAGARTRTIDVTMRRLRAKIECDPSDPERLVTVTGRGYRFVPCEQAHHLIERDGLLAELDRLAARGPGRVLLTGPGGVGKTSLARVWLRRRSSGVEVELLGRSSMNEVMAAVRDAYGLSGESVADEALRHAMTSRAGPLLLDNIDDVQPDVLHTLAEVLSSANVFVLATSRRAPRLPNERVVEVPLLSPEASEELLARHLEAQGVVAREEAVSTLARRTEGLPLAMELAAVRARALGVDELARHLPDHTLLRDDSRPAPHGSLDALLASSWDPLDSEFKQALAYLSGLSGPFDLDRARILLGPATAGAVATLTERSLVHRVVRGEGTRFRILDSVQTFVRARGVVDAAEWDARWQRFARETEGRVREEDPEYIALLHASRDDLLGVFERGLVDRSDIAVLLFGALYFREQLTTLLSVLDRALAEPEPRRMDELLLCRGWCRRRLGDAAGALEDGRRAIQVPGAEERLGHELKLMLGQSVMYIDPAEALRELDALAADPTTPRQTRGMANTSRGHSLRRLGRVSEARDAYQRAVALLLDEPIRLRCAPMIGLGNLALAEGERGEAKDAYQQALALAEQGDDAHTVAVLSANMGVVLLAEHEWDDACEVLTRAAEQHAWLGRTMSRMMALFACGRAHLMAGRLDEAHTTLSTALALAQRSDRVAETCWIGLTASIVQSLRGRHAEARRLLGTDDGNTAALRWIADGVVALCREDVDEAHHCLEQARALAEPELEPEVGLLESLIANRAD